MAKLWSGRFSSDPDRLTDELNASIFFDKRMYREDIEGSLAHAEMLARQGIISDADFASISAGLESVLADIERGAFEFKLADEDIHMAVESELTRRIGDAGKRLHTARSRNDQVAADFRLYCKRELAAVRGLELALLGTLCALAAEHTETVMPGYTHLQRAQPATLAHHLMAYANMLRRDVTRLDDCLRRMDFSPLGSGAFAGTTYPIDRAFTAEKLGFAGYTENSADGVSDRDYALELLSCLAILMTHLSRFAEEVILWCSLEFKFITLSDAFSTGSSIMPQKKNPDIAELVRGKTGRVYGSLVALLTTMKALPLAYNKDMQEDKEQVFDALDTVKKVLPAFTAMIETMTVNRGAMRAAASGGFINATDCADWLVSRGLAFRDAYTVVGKLVAKCQSEDRTLETLTLAEYREAHALFDENVYAAIDLGACVTRRNSAGGPAPEEVAKQIASVRRFLEEYE
ncbi:MAG: argininosuccinate lyase [Oscillospiraceae bacterium]|jgi:argininosuccinate lyase|nr:argininosuccinate lyase [Oscillospiraceae bacterium]